MIYLDNGNHPTTFIFQYLSVLVLNRIGTSLQCSMCEAELHAIISHAALLVHQAQAPRTGTRAFRVCIYVVYVRICRGIQVTQRRENSSMCSPYQCHTYVGKAQLSTNMVPLDQSEEAVEA